MAGPTLEAVLFDVDGTLVDSERHGHRVAFNHAFEALGLPYVWDETLYGRLLQVAGGRERLEHFLAGEGIEAGRCRELAARLHVEKTRCFVEIVEKGSILPRPGARRLIDELLDRRHLVGIVTTGSRDWVEAIVDQHFGLDRFDVIVTGDDVHEKKPDPSAYEMALEKLGIGPWSAVAVEDSIPGFKAAAAARLTCVVVVNDYTRDDDFEGAQLVLDGYGAPGAPVAVVRDPYGVDPHGRLDAEVLRQVHRRSTGDES